jgi:hypothetical protein
LAGLARPWSSHLGPSAMGPLGLVGEIPMTKRIKAIVDAVTDKVLSYRPVDKGLAAKKTKRKLARKAKRDD